MSLQYAFDTRHTHLVQETSDVRFLDESLDLFLSGDITFGMNILRDGLYELYTSTSIKEWDDLLQSAILKHPIKKTLMEDPLTARSFSRPRGYAGDAELLDMIYFPKKMNMKGLSPIGKKLYRYTTDTQIARALRERKALLAEHIDGISDSISNSRILSVACGHCRETHMSRAINNNLIGEFVGIDQDETSLKTANKHLGSFNASTAQITILDIIKGEIEMGKFDLIYSAGLYDYLGKRTAQRLTKKLYDKLLPGGKLVLFNVVPDYQEIGYFESFLNWPLIGRSQEGMLGLVDNIPSNEMATCDVGVGKNNTFHSLTITKS